VKHFKNSQQINYSTDRGSSYADRERNYPSCCCSCCCFHLMFIGPCIIVIVEEEETNLMSQFIKFYFTSSMLNMFRTLIHPSSGACDFSIVSPHWSCVLVSMCVGVSVWLSWGGIRVAACHPRRKSRTGLNPGTGVTTSLTRYLLFLCVLSTFVTSFD